MNNKNAENYADPTATKAIKAVVASENEVKRKCDFLIKVIKFIVSESGFELLNRIELRDKKSRREFK